MGRWLLFVLIGGVTGELPERVCNIPVFRYALERWKPSTYEVIAVHQGPLTDEARAALGVLRQSGANLEPDRIDVLEPVPEKRRALLEKLGRKPPFLVALYPDSGEVAWIGPLSVDSAKSLCDSPARREIARRLLAGDSAVWVLLESRNRKSDALAGLLKTELPRLEQSLRLPAHTADDPPLLSEAPVRIAFSVLRLSREDPQESAFVKILVGNEPGREGPLVVPVFGRGRALWTMGEKSATPEAISEVGEFLTGACSCEAKELNPGVDLLFAADWEAGLAPEADPVPPPAPILRPRAAEPGEAPQGGTGGRALIWVALVGAGLLMAITGRRVLSASKPGK